MRYFYGWNEAALLGEISIDLMVSYGNFSASNSDMMDRNGFSFTLKISWDYSKWVFCLAFFGAYFR
jgi:hypothetical protein